MRYEEEDEAPPLNLAGDVAALSALTQVRAPTPPHPLPICANQSIFKLAPAMPLGLCAALQIPLRTFGTACACPLVEHRMPLLPPKAPPRPPPPPPPSPPIWIDSPTPTRR